MSRPSFPKGDLYQILEVDKNATLEEIKKSYWKLIRESHPDKAGSTAENNEKFSQIRQAYEVLSDPGRRLGYDRYMNVSNGSYRRQQVNEPNWVAAHFGTLEGKAELWLMRITMLENRIFIILMLYSRSPFVYDRTIHQTFEDALLVMLRFRNTIFDFKDNLRARSKGNEALTSQYLRLSQAMTHMEMIATNVVEIVEELVTTPENKEMLLSALKATLEGWINLGPTFQ